MEQPNLTLDERGHKVGVHGHRPPVLDRHITRCVVWGVSVSDDPWIVSNTQLPTVQLVSDLAVIARFDPDAAQRIVHETSEEGWDSARKHRHPRTRHAYDAPKKRLSCALNVIGVVIFEVIRPREEPFLKRLPEGETSVEPVTDVRDSNIAGQASQVEQDKAEIRDPASERTGHGVRVHIQVDMAFRRFQRQLFIWVLEQLLDELF